MGRVSLVPYDPGWPDRYSEIASEIRRCLGSRVAEIHHIGSTSIPGLMAKPTIDVMLVVWSLKALDAAQAGLVALGYRARGEYGIAGRRYFPKDEAGERVVNLHAFQAGDESVMRHLRFRDFLLAHPARRQAYENHKRELAPQFPESAGDYADAKTEFIRAVEAEALAWQRGQDLKSR